MAFNSYDATSTTSVPWKILFGVDEKYNTVV